MVVALGLGTSVHCPGREAVVLRAWRVMAHPVRCVDKRTRGGELLQRQRYDWQGSWAFGEPKRKEKEILVALVDLFFFLFIDDFIILCLGR